MIIYPIIILGLSLIGSRFVNFNEKYLSRRNTIIINGVFVLFVFARHFIQYADLGNNQVDLAFLKFDSFIDQLIVVPFLFFSGFGIAKSIIEKKGYLPKFFRHRFLPLYIQFAICLLIYFAIAFIPSVGENYSSSEILLSFVSWESIGNSNWFIFVTLAQYVITYVCFRFIKKEKYMFGLCFSTLLSIFLLIFLYIYKTSPWYNTLLCFNLGMWYGYFKEKIDLFMRNKKRYLIATLLIFIVFSTLLSIHYIFNKDSLFILVALLFALLVAFISMKIELNSKIMFFFGTHVFSFYMLQRIPMILFDNIISEPFIFFIVCFAITMFLSCSFDLLVRRIKLLFSSAFLKKGQVK